MSADWCLVIMEGLGVIVATVTLWIVTVTLPNRKERKDCKAKLLSGLSSLEKSRRTLLTFKSQYILQRAKNATQLAHYINNISLVEQYINQAFESEKGAPTSTSPNLQPNFDHLAELMNNDAAFKELKGTVNLSIIKKGAEHLYALSDELIKNLYELIFVKQKLFAQSPNTSYLEKSIQTKDLPEKLYFVANYNPGILIGFEQVNENLTQLNFMIFLWNDIIKRHQPIKEPTVQEMVTYISYFLSFSYFLYEIGVDATLMAVKISMDQLVEYARTQFKDHKSFEIYGKSFHEDLMPALCGNSIKIKENLDSMKVN